MEGYDVVTYKPSLAERLARIFTVRSVYKVVGGVEDLFEAMRLTTARAGFARTQTNGYCLATAIIAILNGGAYERVGNRDLFADVGSCLVGSSKACSGWYLNEALFGRHLSNVRP